MYIVWHMHHKLMRLRVMIHIYYDWMNLPQGGAVQFLLSYGRPAQFRPKKVGAGLLHSLFLITMPFSPQVTLHVDQAAQSPQLPSMSANQWNANDTVYTMVTPKIQRTLSSLTFRLYIYFEVIVLQYINASTVDRTAISVVARLGFRIFSIAAVPSVGGGWVQAVPLPGFGPISTGGAAYCPLWPARPLSIDGWINKPPMIFTVRSREQKNCKQYNFHRSLLCANN